MARPVDTSAVAALDVHLLPAAIEHNGEAAVDAYFQPTASGAIVDGLPVLQASLRGRSLSGVKLPLPQGYTGAVLECRAQQAPEPPAGASQDEDACAAAGQQQQLPPAWAASATFSHLHYFNHDAAPLKGDPLRRCLDWAGLAAEVHRPIDPAAVAAAAAAGGEQADAAAGAGAPQQ